MSTPNDLTKSRSRAPKRDYLTEARAARDAALLVFDAAPDLFHACRLALDCVDRFNGKLSPGAIDHLKRAISKATGETK